MRSFIDEFEKRRGEVRRYLAVILMAEKNIQAAKGPKFDEELKIFRAGALLIVYNAIESSARLGILAIYDEIQRTGTTFDELRENFRVQVLSDFKTNVGQKRFSVMRQIGIDLVSNSLDEQKLFSGNVDAKKLKEAAEVYGFDTASEHYLTKHGADLLTVKTRRQDLAHGNQSFSEIGKQYTTADIRRIARFSLAYMSTILHHIDRYLDERGYLEVIPTASDTRVAPPRKYGPLWRVLSLLKVWVGRRSQ